MVNPDMSSAFLNFMRQAATARKNGAAESEAQWLDAAAQLHSLDNASLASHIHALIEQQSHDDAIELAAIIAQLEASNADAHFRLGFGRRNMPDVLAIAEAYLDAPATSTAS